MEVRHVAERNKMKRTWSERDRRKTNVETEKSEKELELEKLVFGDSQDVLRNLDKLQQFDSDRQGAVLQLKQNDESKTQNEDSNSTAKRILKRKPVWQDKDDCDAHETIINVLKRTDKGGLHLEEKRTTQKNYCDELHNRFVTMLGTPSWAKYDANHDHNETVDSEEILKRAGNFIVKSNTLSPGKISVRMEQHLASSLMGTGDISTVEFHPKAQVAMTAYYNGSVVLCQVDGVNNELIQTVKIDNFPINCAHFTEDGEQFIVTSSKTSSFLTYDMLGGKISRILINKNVGQLDLKNFYLSPKSQLLVTSGPSGYIYFFSAKTKEYLHLLKMNSNLTGMAFNSDGMQMYTHSVDGQVYVWDLRQQKCLHKFYDDGCIHGTSIALSSSEQFLATGSDVGVVNVYDTSSLLSLPKPAKTFFNLTTKITHLKFNSSSEMLAIASSDKRAAVRLVHCPSMSVFENFPDPAWRIGHVTSVDYSLNSGYFAIGSKTGNAHLFRLSYYGSY